MSENLEQETLQEDSGDAGAAIEAAVHAEISRALGVAPEDLVVTQRFNHRRVIVPDVTSKFFVHSKRGGESWFTYLSSRSHPNAVEKAFGRARSIAASLSAPLGGHVLLPHWEGNIDGRTYAVTPILEGISTRRLTRMIQRLRLVPMVCDWLESAVGETKHVVDGALVIGPLLHMAGMAGLSAELRAKARAAAREFEGGRLEAIHALNHRDLWSGNVLFRGAGLWGLPQRDFRLIDWGAATMHAAPGYDLLTFTRNSLVPPFFARRRCHAFARVIGCKPAELPHYVIASLAALSCDLGEWPVARCVSTRMRHMEEKISEQ